MKFLSRLRSGWSALTPGALSVRVAGCPFCGPSVFVRLNESEAGMRCVRCAASTVHVSIGLAVAQELSSLSSVSAYELSAVGPFVEHLRKCAGSAVFSEYQPDIVPGTECKGVRCEDVQTLTWPDASFDLVTHTEVFEHVPDDARGFSELRRVLRLGGKMVFTVPLFDEPCTVERARWGGQKVSSIFCRPSITSIRSKGTIRCWCFAITGGTSSSGLNVLVLAR